MVVFIRDRALPCSQDSVTLCGAIKIKKLQMAMHFIVELNALSFKYLVISVLFCMLKSSGI